MYLSIILRPAFASSTGQYQLHSFLIGTQGARRPSPVGGDVFNLGDIWRRLRTFERFDVWGGRGREEGGEEEGGEGGGRGPNIDRALGCYAHRYFETIETLTPISGLPLIICSIQLY